MRISRLMKDVQSHMQVPFRKMHGAGNHFVILDSRGSKPLATSKLVQAMGDIHRGIGFDQLAEICLDGQTPTLTFWNVDGSQANACGNATRCVAHLLMEEDGAERVEVQTPRGMLVAERKNEAIWVNMGAPQLDWRDIPLARDVDVMALPLPGDPVAVGMGNPHCIHFIEDAEAINLSQDGPVCEHNPLYPSATNVEYASVMGTDRLRMRVWERGTGITLACGSGACATVVAAHLKKLTGRSVSVEVDGGVLNVDWREDGVWLSGPVAHVFDGVLTSEFLAGAR